MFANSNTASVEYDFSILGWEKDEYRLSMMDLALEGVMHCLPVRQTRFWEFEEFSAP